MQEYFRRLHTSSRPNDFMQNSWSVEGRRSASFGIEAVIVYILGSHRSRVNVSHSTNVFCSYRHRAR